MILTVFSGCSESGNQSNTRLNSKESSTDNSEPSQKSYIKPSSADNVYSSAAVTKEENNSNSTSNNSDYSASDSYEPTSTNESQDNQDVHNISQCESKVERPSVYPSPNAYLSTISSTYSLAEKQVGFAMLRK